MKINLCLLFLIYYFAPKLYAQRPEEALKYSTIGFGSTARSASMAGAIGAVGNDPASLSYNPSGIAVNRHHVFTFSLATNQVNTSNNYIGQVNINSVNKFKLPSIGIIFTGINYSKKKAVTEGWCNYNFGITLSALSSYNQNFYYNGSNSKSSIADGFAALANKYKDDKVAILNDGGSPENLALQTELIDNYPIYDSSLQSFVNNYQPKYAQQNYGVGRGPIFEQSGVVEFSGGHQEFNLAYGANYSNKLFIGGSIAIGIIRSSFSQTHIESDSGNRINNFKSLTYTEWANTKGQSAGLKFGIIYRATEAFRIGFAMHSSQNFKMHDDYGYSMEVLKDGNSSSSAKTNEPGFYYDYKYKLPTRLIFSMAYVKEKSGLVSMDFEMPNYKKSTFSAGVNTLKDRNQFIFNNYNRGVIWRMGGELYRENFFFRAGLAFYGSPFINRTQYEGASQSKQYLTAGVGYHTKAYNIDVAYVYGQSNNFFTPYSTSNSQNYFSAINQSHSNQIIATLVSRF